MPHQIALVTDSTCDIPAEWIRQYEIAVVPLTIIFGSEQFLDGVELSATQFYERLSKGAQHPTTSQPTPEAFLDAYRRAAAGGVSSPRRARGCPGWCGRLSACAWHCCSFAAAAGPSRPVRSPRWFVRAGLLPI